MMSFHHKIPLHLQIVRRVKSNKMKREKVFLLFQEQANY